MSDPDAATTDPGPARRRRRLPRRVKVLFSGVVVLLGLLVAEGVAQLSERRREAHRAERTRVHYSLEATTREGTRISSEGGTVRLVLDPALLFRLAPGIEAPGITTNALGLRGPPVERAEAPGTFRLVLTGGSAAFGWGASDDAACVAPLLEERLRAGGREVEVLNAGCPAYTLTQEVLYTTVYLLDLEPDLVVSLTGYNDLFDAYTRGDLVTNDLFAQVEERLESAYDLGPALARATALGRRVVRNLEGGPPGAGDGPAPEAFPDPAARRFAAMLERFTAVTEGRLLVALQPQLFAHDVAARPDAEREAVEAAVGPLEALAPFAAFSADALAAQRAALEVVAAGGGRAVDLSRAFAGRDAPYFTDMVHVSDAGNAVVAELLAEAVRGHPAWTGRE